MRIEYILDVTRVVYLVLEQTVYRSGTTRPKLTDVSVVPVR